MTVMSTTISTAPSGAALSPARVDMRTPEPGNAGEGAGILAPVTKLALAAGRPAFTDSPPLRAAPVLDPPVRDLSPADLADLLRALRSRAVDGQLATARENLQDAQVKAKQNTQAQLDKLDAWFRKAEEADGKGRLSKVFGWIGKVLAVVASALAVGFAAVASAATGAAAAPMLVLSGMALVSAVTSLADQVSREAGGPPISLGGFLSGLVGRLLAALGVADDIAKIVVGLAVPVVLLIEPQMLGEMAQGVARLAGADDATAGYVAMALSIVAAIAAAAINAAGTAGAGSASAISGACNRAAAVATQVLQGGTGVAQGGVAVSMAVDRKQADLLVADKADLAASLTKLRAAMEREADDIKKILAQFDEAYQMIARMISDMASTHSQVSANLGRRQVV
ncbi:type III secretion system translocon subunit SctE [Bordetella bronchiseptica]|uniref:type III secretion system translocon subunit SctE n=1 Tax=Bordetella bronchiseptica TaxID=518 RepID=UPI003F74980C